MCMYVLIHTGTQAHTSISVRAGIWALSDAHTGAQAHTHRHMQMYTQTHAQTNTGTWAHIGSRWQNEAVL